MPRAATRSSTASTGGPSSSAAGGEDAHLVCQVHTGLGIEDEARLFYEIDTGRKTLSWWDRWRARRGAGDPQVLGIDEVLCRHRLQVNPAPADGNIRATKALETIACRTRRPADPRCRSSS